MSDDTETEIRRAKEERIKTKGQLVGFGSMGGYDEDLYGSSGDGMVTTIAVAPGDIEEEEEAHFKRKMPTYTVPDSVTREIPRGGGDEEAEDVFKPFRRETVSEREDAYHARVRGVFAKASGQIGSNRSYRERLEETLLEKEEQELRYQLKKKEQEEAERIAHDPTHAQSTASSVKKRSRWDLSSAVADESSEETIAKRAKMSEVDGAAPNQNDSRDSSSNGAAAPAPRRSRWDQTPLVASGGGAASDSGAAPTQPQQRRSRWDQTPDLKSGGVVVGANANVGATPLVVSGAGSRTGSRWDQTPLVSSGTGANVMATPVVASGGLGGGFGGAIQMENMTPEMYQAMRRDATVQRLNRPLSEKELDEILPGEADDFIIIRPPANYVPVRRAGRKPPQIASGFVVSQSTTGLGANAEEFGMTIDIGQGLPELKVEDKPHFEKLLDNKQESEMTVAEANERRVLKLILKVKNGLPLQRKQALRQLSDRAQEFGPELLFNKILPLLMSPTIEEQERHLLVKVIDRILYKLNEMVRPYVRDILNVIQPLLIDTDHYARIEGREIISNLAKAAGLHIMIRDMRPTIDSPDEFVRNVTARAFAVVAAALGPQQMMLFLQAVCKTKKSWQARHTGIKIIQQMAVLLGCAILPYLSSLVDTIVHGLTDEMTQVRIMTALAIASLAEASAPFGIERFDKVLKPLFYGIRQHSGKVLAAFLKAIGFLVPLMDAERASYYSREVMVVLIREFAKPDDDMKRIVLQVVKQCVKTDGVEASYIRSEIVNPFFTHFWINRMALDKNNYRLVVDTTIEIALKIGAPDIVGKLKEALKSESEPFRRMAAEAIDKVVQQLGAAEFDEHLDALLIDGLLYAFKFQTDDSNTILFAFSTVLNALGIRAKPFLTQIQQVVAHMLTYQLPKTRQLACDLVSRIAPVLAICGEEGMMSRLGEILYENLGEEYPDVLGSILGAMKAIVSVIGMTKMNPPIHDLLPRLTPILKNRQEKVQENCIELVGRIADRGKDLVHPKEWMRICFELLEMLRAHKLSIRRAAVSTFGFIAAAIGPAEVLSTLLNNLRVQERTNRVCTTVAIAIVAETCQPFTVLPALMNEYRVPEVNVQNGVLKALSFLFEYISETGKDYIYAITPLLEDALMDRDTVHRQTACTAVKHLALGVAGLGTDDACLHLLNFVWPNIFETSPHVINAVIEAIEGLRVAIGPTIILQYLIQGLFHPARRVRQTFWKVYNSIYVSSADALVPSYPRVELKSEPNYFHRPELDLFI
jgi:splicing factor 3B subunit 1